MRRKFSLDEGRLFLSLPLVLLYHSAVRVSSVVRYILDGNRRENGCIKICRNRENPFQPIRNLCLVPERSREADVRRSASSCLAQLSFCHANPLRKFGLRKPELRGCAADASQNTTPLSIGVVVPRLGIVSSSHQPIS